MKLKSITDAGTRHVKMSVVVNVAKVIRITAKLGRPQTAKQSYRNQRDVRWEFLSENIRFNRRFLPKNR